MYIKCRYFSQKNLATGGGGEPPQMPLTVNVFLLPEALSRCRLNAETIFLGKCNILKAVKHIGCIKVLF